MPEPEFLTDKDWRTLIRDIHAHQVLPVIGPELVTILHPGTGKDIPLHRYLAPLLARRLKLDSPDTYSAINAAACAHLMRRGSRKDIAIELAEMLDDLKPQPSDTLLALARITDFDLFVCSTFDSLLASALGLVRPGVFDAPRDLLAFTPSTPVDIPEPLTSPCVYHILGHYQRTYPEFAVWEEDYMEIICGLLEHQDVMERLFRQLKKRYLLVLGAPFTDWIVRFFFRVARQERLSDRSQNAVGECLTDLPENIDPPLVFFFDKLVQSTTVVPGSPSLFVHELAARWQDRHGQSADDAGFLSRLPLEMPKDSLFISYASEDRAAALALARGLHAAGLPVWLDRGRLEVGENYETTLEAAVRVHCSFFLSLISPATEADAARTRYVHKERDWAAARHMDGFVFYLPVVIHDPRPHGFAPQHEPPCFGKIHAHFLPGGQPTPEFIGKMRSLLESYRASGRPRG